MCVSGCFAHGRSSTSSLVAQNSVFNIEDVISAGKRLFSDFSTCDSVVQRNEKGVINGNTVVSKTMEQGPREKTCDMFLSFSLRQWKPLINLNHKDQRYIVYTPFSSWVPGCEAPRRDNDSDFKPPGDFSKRCWLTQSEPSDTALCSAPDTPERRLARRARLSGHTERKPCPRRSPGVWRADTVQHQSASSVRHRFMLGTTELGAVCVERT